MSHYKRTNGQTKFKRSFSGFQSKNQQIIIATNNFTCKNFQSEIIFMFSHKTSKLFKSFKLEAESQNFAYKFIMSDENSFYVNDFMSPSNIFTWSKKSVCWTSLYHFDYFVVHDDQQLNYVALKMQLVMLWVNSKQNYCSSWEER